MNKFDLTQAIKNKALELGFCEVRVAQAQELQEQQQRLKEWLQRNYHGRMQYLENHFEKRVDPTKLVPGAKSLVCVAMNYKTPYYHNDDPQYAKVSRYAWGDDYHDVLKERLRDLLAYMQSLDPKIDGRTFVDSAPVMEKAWAVKSGIGWHGKNGNIINRNYGSWIFLGEAIVNVELEYDSPMEDFCGSCTRCMDACPTGAIPEPYVIDSNRCIPYLTIELKPQHQIPEELQPHMQNWVFGCDICQEVCPWNIKFSQDSSESRFFPREGILELSLSQASTMSQQQFSERFRKSPVKRTKLAGFLRNVKVALQNWTNSLKTRNNS